MKPVLVKMAFAYPEQLRGDGKDRERIPNHPTRLARDTDFNCWLEDAEKPTSDVGFSGDKTFKKT